MSQLAISVENRSILTDFHYASMTIVAKVIKERGRYQIGDQCDRKRSAAPSRKSLNIEAKAKFTKLEIGFLSSTWLNSNAISISSLIQA